MIVIGKTSAQRVSRTFLQLPGDLWNSRVSQHRRIASRIISYGRTRQYQQLGSIEWAVTFHARKASKSQSQMSDGRIFD